MCKYLMFVLFKVPIPLERFLEPEETNVALVRRYCQALISGTVRPRRTPLPYLIAVHHVNRFLYRQNERRSSIKREMLKYCVQLPNEVLCKLYYNILESQRAVLWCILSCEAVVFNFFHTNLLPSF